MFPLRVVPVSDATPLVINTAPPLVATLFTNDDVPTTFTVPAATSNPPPCVFARLSANTTDDNANGVPDAVSTYSPPPEPAADACVASLPTNPLSLTLASDEPVTRPPPPDCAVFPVNNEPSVNATFAVPPTTNPPPEETADEPEMVVVCKAAGAAPEFSTYNPPPFISAIPDLISNPNEVMVPGLDTSKYAPPPFIELEQLESKTESSESAPDPTTLKHPPCAPGLDEKVTFTLSRTSEPDVIRLATPPWPPRMTNPSRTVSVPLNPTLNVIPRSEPRQSMVAPFISSTHDRAPVAGLNPSPELIEHPMYVPLGDSVTVLPSRAASTMSWMFWTNSEPSVRTPRVIMVGHPPNTYPYSPATNNAGSNVATGKVDSS